MKIIIDKEGEALLGKIVDAALRGVGTQILPAIDQFRQFAEPYKEDEDE